MDVDRIGLEFGAWLVLGADRHVVLDEAGRELVVGISRRVEVHRSGLLEPGLRAVVQPAYVPHCCWTRSTPAPQLVRIVDRLER